MSPDDFIQETLRRGCQGTSISFNEPTLSLEWSREIFQLAREHILYNTFVTNGYMTDKALTVLVEAGLDAMNVDVKGNAPAVRKHCKGIDVERVWRRCRQARDLGLHLEITTLVIPGVNDDDECLKGIAGRIATELGVAVPWHVSGYFPAYRFMVPPTSVKTLERAWNIGRKAGIKYVYIGNVPGHPNDDTYCPGCGELIIKRWGFRVMGNYLSKGNCPACGIRIPGVWIDST